MIDLPNTTELGALRFCEYFSYSDGPKSFSCQNIENGQLYLALWLKRQDDGSDRWLYIPVSRDRLDLIRLRKVTLRDACTSPEFGNIWIVEVRKSKTIIQAIAPDNIPEADIPKECVSFI